MTSSELAIANLKQAGLAEVLYTPGQEAYDARVASYWSLTARLSPRAFVQPRDVGEVSQAVSALVKTPGCNFAVRSGGHMVWPGASNIDDGITIDLGRMAGVTYDPKTEIASLLPGGKWADMYMELEKRGRMIAGGREGAVGIGGLLTGGGLTFYTCRLGFGCDQVVNYEVVLADGSVVQANDGTNSDLFRALKGGGNNFGIVTRFDIITFPARDIWDGIVAYTKDSTPQLVQATANFVANLAARPDSHILMMWTMLPKSQDHFIAASLTNLDGVEDGESLKELSSIPSIQNEMKVTTIATKLTSFVIPAGKENTWFTLTYRNDPRVIQKSAEVYEALMEKLKTQVPDGDFSSMMVLQPLLASFGQHAAARGGNMLGLERIKEDCVLLVWSVEVATMELNKRVVSPALKAAVNEIEAFAVSLGADNGFLYLNYCDGSQNPLASYGEENVRKMREVAAKYDPEGVFQTRVPGGFKISRVNIGNDS